MPTVEAIVKELCSNVLNRACAGEDIASISHWLLNNKIVPPLMESEEFIALNKWLGYRNIVFRKPSAKRRIAEEQLSLFLDDVPYPPVENPSFTFIDLFAGIGGFRQAMQSQGGNCVFSSEWDKYAAQTYFRNYGEMPYGDIRLIDPVTIIPNHDVLCAGFPCQPFSLAGVSKKNSLGRKHGFEDETQGTLFFNVAKIIKEKQPKAFFLENVKNLFGHDNGKTFEVIRRTLVEELGYVVNWKVVQGGNWVPQGRQRLFIVGYNPTTIDISDVNEIIIPDGPTSPDYEKPQLSAIIQSENVPDKYTLGEGTWATLERHKAHHANAGNGFGYGLHEMPIKENDSTRTISARYHKDGAEILIEQKGKRPRRLMVEEAMQLQGYEKGRFVFPVSDSQAYKQIGNSVVVPAVRDTAKEIVKILDTRGK
nr:DNA (cytosine-5-)-methyltransferase [uncultured Undibacterium sp.]